MWLINNTIQKKIASLYSIHRVIYRHPSNRDTAMPLRVEMGNAGKLLPTMPCTKSSTSTHCINFKLITTLSSVYKSVKCIMGGRMGITQRCRMGENNGVERRFGDIWAKIYPLSFYNFWSCEYYFLSRVCHVYVCYLNKNMLNVISEYKSISVSIFICICSVLAAWKNKQSVTTHTHTIIGLDSVSFRIRDIISNGVVMWIELL